MDRGGFMIILIVVYIITWIGFFICATLLKDTNRTQWAALIIFAFLVFCSLMMGVIKDWQKAIDTKIFYREVTKEVYPSFIDHTQYDIEFRLK